MNVTVLKSRQLSPAFVGSEDTLFLKRSCYSELQSPITSMKLHAPCSMLRLRPHYLLRLQNNHNVPFNNGKQEEALTCRTSDVNSSMDINLPLFVCFFVVVNFTAQIQKNT